MASKNRILELDSIRGVAALSVLIFHLPVGFAFGATGVDLFFVLSGYLITDIILRSREKDRFLWNFVVRRSIRIWPIYYLSLAFILTINSIRSNPESVQTVWYYVFYIQNVPTYWGASFELLPHFGHTWTLAIEEQFYLVWPIAVGVFYMPRRWLFLLCITLVVGSVIGRSIGIAGSTLVGHFDGLALGGALSCVLSSRLPPGSRSWPLIFAIVSTLFFVVYFILWLVKELSSSSTIVPIAENFGILIVSLAYASLVGCLVLAQNHKWLAVLRNPVLCYLGTISYGLYLYHWIIYELMDTLFKFRWGYNDPWWLSVLKVVLSIVAAVASWHLIESPILRLKKYFDYDRQSGSKSSVEIQQAYKK